MAMTQVQAGRDRRRGEGDRRSHQGVADSQIIEHSLQHKVRLQSLSEKFGRPHGLPTLGLGALAGRSRAPAR